MLRMAPDYDHLTLLQKVEVFEHAMCNTAGDDLARLLWLKSPSSEVWFDRRTNYTRSLAVMSMVGYILGLGDRHTSNLMLDRLRGKILHIDFGDCFEVAMTREKFPEKIPFRLTRMLTNAMEVTGLDGNYRITCHNVVEVLREHRDSVMAVLEAFVYDPLLNWRLMDTTSKGAKHSRSPTDSYSASQEMLEPMEVAVSHKKPGSAMVDADLSFLGDGFVQHEALNKKAISIINRVRDKLTGRDFSHEETLDVPTQVDLLIKQATSHENLCQCYIASPSGCGFRPACAMRVAIQVGDVAAHGSIGSAPNWLPLTREQTFAPDCLAFAMFYQLSDILEIPWRSTDFGSIAYGEYVSAGKCQALDFSVVLLRVCVGLS
uniref:serine/threonine-protein kinase mTOR-like n=1 Tax=Myxine glutinosa TaxID=7769 RepID=UPI00358E8336